MKTNPRPGFESWGGYPALQAELAPIVLPAELQRVVPSGVSPQLGMIRILKAISTSGLASFRAVIKVFGDVPSPGMLSRDFARYIDPRFSPALWQRVTASA